MLLQRLGHVPFSHLRCLAKALILVPKADVRVSEAEKGSFRLLFFSTTCTLCPFESLPPLEQAAYVFDGGIVAGCPGRELECVEGGLVEHQQGPWNRRSTMKMTMN